MRVPVKKQPVWNPTRVQFLYRRQNKRYYVRTFAAGKEKWTSLQTKLLAVSFSVNLGVVLAAARLMMWFGRWLGRAQAVIPKVHPRHARPAAGGGSAAVIF